MSKVLPIKAKEPKFTEAGNLLLPEHYRLVSEDLCKLVGKTSIVVPEITEHSSKRGWFGIPAPSKEAGIKYVVYAIGDGGPNDWSTIEAVLNAEQRSISQLELCYLRNMFFSQACTVVSYYPTHNTLVAVGPKSFQFSILASPNDKIIRVPPRIKL